MTWGDFTKRFSDIFQGEEYSDRTPQQLQWRGRKRKKARQGEKDHLLIGWTSTMAIPMSSVISECQADQLMDPVIQSQSSFMINIKVTQVAIHLINLMTMLSPFSVVAFLDIFGMF